MTSGVVSFSLAVLAAGASAQAQTFSYRGFTEVRATGYPQTTPKDDDRIAVEGRIRFEPAVKPVQWLTVSLSTDARVDNLEQVERRWRIDFRDRGLQRPALLVRQASATFRKGGITADAGKQFIRWGKADILTPTDRFAPRDFLEVTDNEFLAVTGVRVQYQKRGHTFDAVWVPLFTPSRIPLLNRRWAATPQTAVPVSFVDLPSVFPHRSQLGVRWNVVSAGYEFSLSYFDGFNHLPQLATFPLSSMPAIAVQRSYSPLRMAGADAAIPLRWVTVKGEAASLTATRGALADSVVLYVVQLERQAGELSLVGGYAGEVVTARRSSFIFAPDRGLARTFLGRADYTIDTHRSLAFEAAVRQTGKGVWIKGEYSQAAGAHWRTTVAGTVIGGREEDFFGQYRRNSHLLATLRYSF